jgi:hypothetical protein
MAFMNPIDNIFRTVPGIVKVFLPVGVNKDMGVYGGISKIE